MKVGTTGIKSAEFAYPKISIKILEYHLLPSFTKVLLLKEKQWCFGNYKLGRQKLALLTPEKHQCSIMKLGHVQRGLPYCNAIIHRLRLQVFFGICIASGKGFHTSHHTFFHKNVAVFYPLVNKHNNGKSSFSIRNTSSKGSFSIAMLVYQRVSNKISSKVHRSRHDMVQPQKSDSWERRPASSKKITRLPNSFEHLGRWKRKLPKGTFYNKWGEFGTKSMLVESTT